MAVNVLVHFFFYGLVAFVPDYQDNPSEVTALLVNAHVPPQAGDGCGTLPHHPKLYYKTLTQGCDLSHHCYSEGSSCVCSLNRDDLQIASSAPGVRKSGDFGFVTHMRTLSRRASSVDLDLLKASFPDRSAPEKLTARVFRLKVADSIQAVKMVGEPDGKPISTQFFSFESLVDVPNSVVAFFSHPHRESRLAEAIMIPSLIAGRLSKTGKVLVDIPFRSLDPGGAALPLTIEAESCGEQYCASVIIENRMDDGAHEATEGYCHNVSIGRHFELFYELSRNEIDFTSRPVPRLRVESSQSNAKAEFATKIVNTKAFPFWQAFISSPDRAGENRPICPLVVLSN